MSKKISDTDSTYYLKIIKESIQEILKNDHVDENIIQAQAVIAAFTKEEDQIKALTAATIDFAAAKGVDLVTAADLVAKSFGSSTNALSRYGVQVEGAAGSTERLEQLTQAERDVLYEVRDFARFREEFYVDIFAAREGFLSLLLQLQNIRNGESNLASLERNLLMHEHLVEAGVVSPIQVDQVFQSYQRTRLSLIRVNNDFETSLDAFKIKLGLRLGSTCFQGLD